MKKFLFVTLFSILSIVTFANHTKGGWMYYEYMGPGSSPNLIKYRITLKLYTACVLSSGQFNATINFSVFDAINNQLLYSIPVTYSNLINIQNCTSEECHPCISPIPAICYKIITYQVVQDLPRSANGYIFAYQRCCRISNIVNLQSPSNNVGETWTVTIPGTAIAPGAETNSSARFSQNDTAIICEDNFFTFDFSATDINNDSLVYDFTSAFGGGSTGNATPDPASSPPYAPISYSSGFSGSQPLGSRVTIDHKTGIVSGIAPFSGIYVVTVTVSEYKRGTNIKIAQVRKSLHIEVANCSLTQAVLNPEYISCDGFTLTFFNNGSSANIQTYEWEFGDGGTSTLPSPTHTYADTGIYILKLFVNRGLPCSDSTTAQVRVYPGFFPDFSSGGQCTIIPIQFNDRTTTTYPFVNSWQWNFGDPSSPANTSILQNPVHTYTIAGNYDITFIVTSSKGCIDTVLKTIAVLDSPPLTVSNDTLICVIDTLQLSAVGTGTFLWTPNYMINNVTSATPLVSPDVTTTYHVTLTDAFGCFAKDSVKVKVVNFVTQAGNYDTTICRGDPITLRLTSDALRFAWTPNNGSLNDTTLQNPVATTINTTIYHVVGSISAKCFAENYITVIAIPYPPANAGLDIPVCLGNSTQLHASGGSIYSWSPTLFLNNSHIPDPLVTNPSGSVRYIVTVRDVLGCPKPVNDTVIVRVISIKADAGPADTSVVLGQPLQLGATGGTNYEWTPATWLNDPNIHNPISLPQNNITYFVKVSDANGCIGYDNIIVRVYFVKPDIYVPTAFSPNGDYLNEFFKPTLLGLKSLDDFKVFNRWGQMLYSASGNKITGWDGTFAGRPQESATYVWYAQATDYLNKTVRRKGYVVLIR